MDTATTSGFMDSANSSNEETSIIAPTEDEDLLHDFVGLGRRLTDTYDELWSLVDTTTDEKRIVERRFNDLETQIEWATETIREMLCLSGSLDEQPRHTFKELLLYSIEELNDLKRTAENVSGFSASATPRSAYASPPSSNWSD